MALTKFDEVSLRLKFLHRQNRFSIPPLRKLLCDALIQLLFDYVSTASFRISQTN